MASILPGYEYDIFISYRQKDNKGDKWVSEFVTALKSELDATFKEDITIYFDENPHDGLLETHDVDESLKDKLKCLVFIPIISKTYCDQKSFAWEHEFMAFVELASNDHYGLKVKLPSGNVASRVLPVRIHDLEPADHMLCESVLGGVIRGVDFVYRSSGVNRPLRTNEEYPLNNLNKTFYRDQINKVANAIDEIFHSLKNKSLINEKDELNVKKVPEEIIYGKRRRAWIPEFSVTKKIRRSILFLSFLICAAAAILIYSVLDKTEIRRSVAILPFSCPENDPKLIASGDILSELALSKLQNVTSLTIRSRISTIPYRNTKKSLSRIRKELDVNYIVDGTVRSDAEKTMIWVSLVDARHDKQLWSSEYLWDNNHISGTVSEIAREIAYWCEVELSPEELKQIDSSPTRNSKAYLNFLTANVTYSDAWNFFNTGTNLLDTNDIRKAVRDYDRAIIYDSLFAEAYARRAIATSWGYFIKQFDSTCIEKCYADINKALKLDPHLTDAQVAMGCYYYFCRNDNQKALEYFNRTAVLDPTNYQPLYYMALVYRKRGEWEKSQYLISKVIQQNPQVPLFLTNIGLSYNYLHKFDSAIMYHQKAIDIMPEWSAPYVNKIESLILKGGKTKECRRLISLTESNTGRKLTELEIRLDLYDGKLKEALNLAENLETLGYHDLIRKLMACATISQLLNDRAKAAVYYDSALVAMGNVEMDYTLHGEAAIAYAGLDNKEKAMAEAKLSVDLSANNKMDESDMRMNQAKVLTMLGDYDSAVNSIKYLLENPSAFSKKLLQLDPVWKPLLKTPAGSRLLEEYSE